ncbi:retinol-binding protein pinta-like isoform X1 [Temnothorax curvispinosus]|uniref:Retinol-binding protein pinta-like isoform X1 n=1 Tax=Temnothorax curvispinosus TaxID=300111 RepID=A0A6J1PV63_9HYME|nr:retinol-binding protein pinta-like isoform X1 [Temnothorax curvispinosus]
MASSCSHSVMDHAWKKLSNDDKLYAASQLNETDKNRENSIAEIRRWIQENDDFRGQFDDFLILRFLRVCKFNLEKTKIRIQSYYKQRSDVPEWYMNKDPYLPELQELLDMGFCLPLRNPDDQGRLVILVRIIYDPTRHEISNLAKIFLMVLETAIKHYPAASIYGYTLFMDFANTTIRHIAQYRPYILKNSVRLWQNYPMSVKLINIFNAPLIFEVTAMILKSFMTEKLKNRFNVHSDSTVHNCLKDIPANILPVECGGTDGTIQELTEYWKKLIEENRDSLLNEDDKIVSKHYMQNRLKDNPANIEYDGTDGTIQVLTERWKKLVDDDHVCLANEENEEIITKL